MLTMQQNLGGLKIVVRFEVDAYIEDPVETEELPSEADPSILSLAGLTLSDPSKTKFGLKILRKGPSKAPDLSNLVELTTSSGGFGYRKKDQDAQLYLSGTPWLIIAYHDQGNFRTIQKRSFLSSSDEEKKRKWDRDLTLLATFLRSIKDVAAQRGENVRMSLIYDRQHRDVVKIYKPLRQDSFLPTEMLRRFT